MAHSKIELIKSWVAAHPKVKFDMTFVDSVQEFYNTTCRITPSQEDALDNIIERFRMKPVASKATSSDAKRRRYLKYAKLSPV